MLTRTINTTPTDARPWLGVLDDRNAIENIIERRPTIPSSLAAEVLLVHGFTLAYYIKQTGREWGSGYDAAAILEWLGY